MPLASTREAIGAVAELLRSELTTRTSATTVDIGRPESAAGGAGPKFNLFLYQLDLDGGLRNHPLDQGQPPPLWLVARFLMTAFDGGGESDTSDALRLLGEGMLALQEMNFQEPAGAPLVDNPEPLKITFDHADADLLSKIMQGQNEHYRMSVAFQVRPLMLAFTSPASSAPLVLTIGPPGSEGVVVLPSMGPFLNTVTPERFQAGDTLTLRGRDLSSTSVVVVFDAVQVVPTSVRQDEVVVTVPATLSAKAYLLRIAYVLPAGHLFSSNPLLGHLVPKVTGANVVGALTAAGGNRFGTLHVAGSRLGGLNDSVFVSFFGGGTTVLTMQVTGAAPQTDLTVNVQAASAIPAGAYLVLVRVNGEQATNAPSVNWI
jgi:hypothetical protein